MIPTPKWLMGGSMLVALYACTSTPESLPEADDLDVTMDSPSAEVSASQSPEATSRGIADKSGKAPAEAVMDWQAFFKPPPSPAQRSLLEVQLDKWTDTERSQDLVRKGRAEVVLGRLAFAETSFRKALRLVPTDVEAQLELAALYLRKKDYQKSFEFLAQVKEGINTQDNIGQSFIFRYRYILALAYIGRNDREKGHKVLSDLIGVDKAFAPAYAALAESYLDLGRDSVAEFVVRRGLDRAKDNSILLNLMGIIAKRGHQHETARLWFDKALAVDAQYAPALVNRANLAIRAFEYAAAEEDLKVAIAVDPLNADALVALGIVQRKQGNHSAAKVSLTKAIDLDPESAYARFNLGVLMADDLKKPNEALRLFHEVLQTPGPENEVKNLARSYIQEIAN